MEKILKGPSNLVRRVLSKSSNLSQSSSSHENNPKMENERFMSEEQQLANEIKSLKDQIDRLKAVISNLQEDAEKKEVAIAKIARDKEKITVELLKQQRSNKNLLQQLEEERTYYYKEKEIYCQEMNQFKKLKRALSNSTTSISKNELPVEFYKHEIEKIKQTLRQTLGANYNLSIKFLRMKNTKTCLKTELKTVQLEHEKLVADYKTKIQNISEELNNLIQERLSAPISFSSKKYLHLVKQNSCLVYENLCLQLEIDNLHLHFDKLKLKKSRSEANCRLKYIKNEYTKPKHLKRPLKKEHKIGRMKEERIEGDMAFDHSRHLLSISHQHNKEIYKIFERCQMPGIPDIKVLNDFENSKQEGHIPKSQDSNIQVNAKRVPKKSSSKLALFQVSNASSSVSTETWGRLVKVQSSPQIARRVKDY
ncbi:chromosome partition protein Smc-like [Euwallacea fornicatus]|uniref:chromosome partition protein Smc-like n=1 Tax=Euwallacea fornicatus TaxID=995702 RepID=UPI00338DE338